MRHFIGNFCVWVIVCVIGVGFGLVASLATFLIGIGLVSGGVVSLEHWFLGWAVAGFIGVNLTMGAKIM